jgi:hypothetical protein
MTLFEQIEAKGIAREHFIQSQERLISNLEKSITLVKHMTDAQLKLYDDDIVALETTVGIVRDNVLPLNDLQMVSGGRQ